MSSGWLSGWKKRITSPTPSSETSLEDRRTEGEFEPDVEGGLGHDRLFDEQRRVVAGPRARAHRLGDLAHQSERQSEDHLGRFVVTYGQLQARDEEHLVGAGELHELDARLL